MCRDAAFEAVHNTQRCYVLRFESSNARHFYWAQDADDRLDEWRANRINQLFADPESVAPPLPNLAPSSTGAASESENGGHTQMSD